MWCRNSEETRAHRIIAGARISWNTNLWEEGGERSFEPTQSVSLCGPRIINFENRETLQATTTNAQAHAHIGTGSLNSSSSGVAQRQQGLSAGASARDEGVVSAKGCAPRRFHMYKFNIYIYKRTPPLQRRVGRRRACNDLGPENTKGLKVLIRAARVLGLFFARAVTHRGISNFILFFYLFRPSAYVLHIHKHVAPYVKGAPPATRVWVCVCITARDAF